MVGYNLKLGWQSLRRTPVLSSLAIAAIALGIGVATTCVTIHYLLAGDPLPGKSDRLFYVRLDSWDPERPFDSDFPERPPNQLTYRDALAAVVESDIPARKAAMFRARLYLHPEGAQPFSADTRVTTRDFFALFAVPFRFGDAWSAEAEARGEAQVVLSAEINRKLFGEANSVGRTIKIDQQIFTVAGVLAPWRPALKFYDIHNGSERSPEEIYIPFALARPLGIVNAGNTSSWGQGWQTVDGKYDSEAVWLQGWVELESDSQKQAYQSFLDQYTDGQRAAGRFQRKNNNQLQPMRAWHQQEEAVPPSAKSLMVIALAFLGICAVNLIGLLLGKFLARAPEVGVRRALGASRAAVFVQHLVECELTAVGGGLAGILLSWGVLGVINRALEGDVHYRLDLPMIGTGFGLTLVAGLVAGLYPAWRICSVPPATHLKLQ
ncbi:MAG: FtsX-like permease family protein [Thermoanaerobaculia bacterium]|nr:FtsX-like permease family protein [Thermoanaerobaculia bacterium]